MPKKAFIIIAFILFPLVVGLACLSSRPDPTATPRAEAVVETEATIAAATPEITTEEEVEEPTPPTIAVLEGLEMLDQSMWVQDGAFVFVAYLFENFSSDVLYEDVEFTISLYDTDGKLIDQDYHSMPWFFPNQTFGLVSNFWFSIDTIVVDTVELDWNYSRTSSPGSFVNPFTTDSIVFWDNGGYPLISGKVVNKEATTYTDIRVNVICYDSTDAIIGGGYTFVDFIHLDDFMGFTTYADTFGDIASCEVFPILTYVTQFIDKTDFMSEISVLDSHFYSSDFGFIDGGFVLKNETDSVLSNSLVYITFFDENDNITATAIAYVDLILPGESLGIAPWVTTPPEEVEGMRYDILMLPGDPLDEYELESNTFKIESTSISAEDDSYVLVSFTNTSSKMVSELDVYVLLYNADGQIIGGGREWTKEPTPAGGTSEIEFWVTYASFETIETIEAWVTPSYWTEFE